MYFSPQIVGYIPGLSGHSQLCVFFFAYLDSRRLRLAIFPVSCDFSVLTTSCTRKSFAHNFDWLFLKVAPQQLVHMAGATMQRENRRPPTRGRNLIVVPSRRVCALRSDIWFYRTSNLLTIIWFVTSSQRICSGIACDADWQLCDGSMITSTVIALFVVPAFRSSRAIFLDGGVLYTKTVLPYLIMSHMWLDISFSL